MNYYCSTIPLPLAEKLKEKGMPIRIWREVFEDKEGTDATFGDCFDWLMSEKNTNIYFDKDRGMWSVFIENENNPVSNCEYLQGYSTWHEAANAAIEKALTLI